MTVRTKATLTILVVTLIALHQDFWFWREARPLLFGFLPPALWYHVAYCFAASALMAALVKWAWPDEHEEPRSRDREPGA